MAWEDELFAVLEDLEGEAEAAFGAERHLELGDRSRTEYAEVRLDARLMASLDTPVVLGVAGVGDLAGTLARVARGWCLLAGAQQDWVVRIDAVETVRGASDRAVPPVAWPAVARLGLGSALRRLADAGERCRWHTTSGRQHEGRLRRIGHDFAELVPEGTATPGVVLVALGSLAAVSSDRLG